MNKLPEKVFNLTQLRIDRSLKKKCQCKRRRFIVDEKNREVTCADCGTVIDAFEAISDMAKEFERYYYDVERLLKQKKQIKNYKPRMKVIKELESNLRGPNKMYPVCPKCNQPFEIQNIKKYVSGELADRIANRKE